MQYDYLEIANSGLLWIACIPAVLWVLLQSFIFGRKSVVEGKRMGMTTDDFKKATRSTMVAAIGPCFVMFGGMIALMVNIGAPMAWLRLNFIGASAYELFAADFAAKGVGAELGTASMNVNALLNIAWVMPLGCLGWVAFSGLFADKMDKVNKVMGGGNTAIVVIMGIAAIIGAFASLSLQQAMPFNTRTYAVIASAITMALITIYNKKHNKQWLKEWGISISMVAGMIAAVIMHV